MGLERDTFGDILVENTGAYIVATETIIPFIETSLNSIGRYKKLNIKQITEQEMQLTPLKTKMMQLTVASLRLDAILAASFGISRSESSKLLTTDKVKCNGISVSNSYMLKEGDIITARGFGKVRLATINGMTKKERLHVTVEKYI